MFIRWIVTYPVDSVIHPLNNGGQHYTQSLPFKNYLVLHKVHQQFPPFWKRDQNARDWLWWPNFEQVFYIWSWTTVCHGLCFRRTDGWRTEQLRLLSLAINLHRIDARNSPKQAKNETLNLYLSWHLSVSSWDREIELKTVSLTTKSWDLRGLDKEMICKKARDIIGH